MNSIQTDISPRNIQPIHGVNDDQKFCDVWASMLLDGWVGRPILAIGTEDWCHALTGSHRLAAAQRIGFNVPVLLIPCESDWTEDYSLDTEVDRRELVEAFGDEAAIRLLGEEGE